MVVFLLCLHMVFLLCLHPNLIYSYKGTGRIGLGPTRVGPRFTFLTSLKTVSKYNHNLRYWGWLELQHMNFIPIIYSNPLSVFQVHTKETWRGERVGHQDFIGIPLSQNALNLSQPLKGIEKIHCIFQKSLLQWPRNTLLLRLLISKIKDMLLVQEFQQYNKAKLNVKMITPCGDQARTGLNWR